MAPGQLQLRSLFASLVGAPAIGAHRSRSNRRPQCGELRRVSGTLGLPNGIRACLFDLDGVLTRTATVHAAAWKEMFDAFLRDRADAAGRAFEPFDPSGLRRYVDGKLRHDGVRSFLASRGIELPEGAADDSARRGDRHRPRRPKERARARADPGRGVRPYPARSATCAGGARGGAAARGRLRERELPRGPRGRGPRGAVRGARRRRRGRAEAPARQAGAGHVSGRGRGARRPPAEAAVFEDALAGVAAGRAGGFGLVVGVDRVGHAEALPSTAPTSWSPTWPSCSSG